MRHAQETMARVETALAQLRLVRNCLTPRPPGADNGAALIDALLRRAHDAVARAACEFAAHNAGDIRDGGEARRDG